jgi:hypothetical protein
MKWNKEDNDERNQYFAKIWETTAKEPFAWWANGQNLLFTARILQKQFPHYSPTISEHDMIGHSRISASMMMLYALAVENFLKAVVVKTQDKSRLIRDFNLTDEFAHHDLLKLARSTPLHLDKKRTSLLKRLSAFAKDGKYPVSRKPKKMSSLKDPAGDLYYNSSELEMIPKICQELTEFVLPGEDILKDL